MSSLSTSRGKKADPLAKRTPQNPKFKNVRSQIDTGASLTRYMEKLDDIKANYKFRKDEIFKRMKASTFVHLLIQVYQINQENSFEEDESYTDRPDTADAEVAGVQHGMVPPLPFTDGDLSSRPDTSRSTLLSVARGVGELDLNPAEPSMPLTVKDEMPYLLLDVREADDFENCHIMGAINYPKSYLSRATNYEIKVMHTYRNKPGKVVIVYDEDERIAPQCAQTLVQRGYDNLFMLSGGMRVAYKQFPEGLFTGNIPPTITGVKARTEQKAGNRIFSQQDIDSLEIQLEGHFTDKLPGSASRLSKASTASSRMSDNQSVTARSSMSTMSGASSRPPFR